MDRSKDNATDWEFESGAEDKGPDEAPSPTEVSLWFELEEWFKTFNEFVNSIYFSFNKEDGFCILLNFDIII